jgi:iron(III) transport system permease protein
LLIAFGTTLMATFLGVATGIVLGLYDIPFRKTLLCLLSLPFLVPSYVAAIAWVDMLGRAGYVVSLTERTLGYTWSGVTLYSIFGCVWVQSLSLFPLVMVATAVGVHRFDARLLDAAALNVTGWGTVRNIILPTLSPVILTSVTLVFLMALTAFSVPSLLQVAVYPVEIHTQFNAFYDVRAAVTQAIPLVVCGALAVFFWSWRVRLSAAWLSGKHRALKRAKPVGHSRWVVPGACWLLVGVSVGAPLFALLIRAQSPATFAEVFQTAGDEIVVTLATGAVTATCLTAFALAIALAARASRCSRWMGNATLVGFLVSGPVVGVGLIRTWNNPVWPDTMSDLVYTSVAMLILATIARFVFFAYRAVAANFRAHDPRLDEAAAVCGVSLWQRTRHIHVPLLAPGLAAVWALSFVLAVGEVDTAVLVSPPGVTVLPVRLFALMHYGPSRYVAALSLITVVLVLAIAAVPTVYAWKRGSFIRAGH